MSKQDELFELLKDEPLPENAAVLAYESGNVLEQAMYLLWADRHGGCDQKDVAIIKAKMKAELMDVMAQASVLCRKLGEDPTDWLEMGCEKAVEAITKKRDGKLASHIEGKW